MKKILGVLVAIAMCACLCFPAFALDSDILSGLGDLDLENFDIGALTDGFDLEGIKDTVSGLIGGAGEGSDSALGDFDPTGALSSFVESLDLSQITDLFSGLTDALGSIGITLPEGGADGFDITSILGGNSGDGAGLASVMDVFGGVLESLGLDSSVIESLGDSDIVNFFANLYMGSVPEETPTEAEPSEEAPTTTKIHNPDSGVNDGAAVVAACATLSVAAAAVYVCSRKKHA